MSVEQNKQIALQFHQAYNNADLEAARALLGPGFVAHVAGMPGPVSVDAFKDFGQAYLTAFPDSASDVKGVFGEGDYVCTFGDFTGTQKADFMGIPSTGKTFTMTFTHVFRLSGGKIVEIRVDQDNLAMMQQIGAIPAPQG